MNRCLPKRVHFALAICLAFGAMALPSSAVQAQGIVREVPKDVVLATMSVGLPPQITLNGQADRLSPGSRIRDLNNMVVLSGALSGKTFPVVYRRDAAGLVHEAWMLSPQEYQKLSGVMPGAYGGGVQQFLDMLALIFGARR